METDGGRKANIGLSVRLFPVTFGVIHAVIDAASVMVIFNTKFVHHFSHLDMFYLILSYDLLAFAGQAPLGLFLDRWRLTRPASFAGIILCFLGVLVLRIQPTVAMILVGLGNALFHVGAGALSLHVRPGRATPPGLFVAPGALGLALGTWLGKGGVSIYWPFLLALFVSFAIALVSRYPEISRIRRPKIPKVKFPILIVLLLLLSVTIRSFVGRAGAYECPKLLVISFGFAFAAFAGKAVGGVLSDRFGWIEISVGALLISAPFIAFGGANPVLLISGLFIFQMTMPVTLVAVYSLLPGRPAFAFGLNCLAYILGFLPTLFPVVKAQYQSVGFFLLILVSAAAVYVGLRAIKNEVPMKFTD